MSYTLEEYTVLHHPTGMKLKVEIIADDHYGAPEQEHDGHGVIEEFDYDPTDVEALIEREGWDEDEQCSPEAMEAVARAGLFKPIGTDSRWGRYNKYYDVWETLKIAVSQWGLSADDPDELTRVVIADYEYVNGWYCSDWRWAVMSVTPLDAEGEHSANRRLAEAIATEIKGILDRGDEVHDKETKARRAAHAPLRVRPPGRRQHQLVVLRAQQRAQLAGKRHEGLVGEQRRPEGAPIGVVLELPQVNQFVDRPDVAGEITDQSLRMAADRRIPLGPVELDHLAHLAHHHLVGAHFIDRHQSLR